MIFAGFNDAKDGGCGMSDFNTLGKEPAFAANHKGFNGALILGKAA